MAYKFQLGAAILSGSLTQEGQVLAKDSALSGSSLSLAGTAVTSTAAELNILAGVTADADEINVLAGVTAGTAAASKALVLDGSSDLGGINDLSLDGALSASAGVSGSVVQGGVFVGANFQDGLGGGFTVTSVLNATGGISIQGVTLNASATDLNVLTNVVDATFDGANDKLIFSDADDSNNFKTMSRESFASSLASGTGIVESAGQLAVDGVLEDLDTLGAAASDGQFIVATGAGAFQYESGATVRTSLGLGTGDSPTFTGLTLSGDLTVNGTQTIINSTAVEIADKNILLASGSADGNAANGAGLTIEGPEVQWKYSTNGFDDSAGTGADASASGDIWMASGSSGLIAIQADKFYGGFVGDGASLTGIVADAVVENVSSKTSNYTLDNTSETIVLADATSNSVALTLPAASGLGGVIFKVKRIDSTLANNVTIVPATGESLEFVTNNTVYLETQGAALSLVCNGTAWFIM